MTKCWQGLKHFGVRIMRINSKDETVKSPLIYYVKRQRLLAKEY